MKLFESINHFEKEHQKKLARNLIILVIPFFGVFSLYNFYIRNYPLAFVNLFMCISQVVILFIIKKRADSTIPFRIDIFFIVLNFYHNIYQSMYSPESILWVSAFPFATFVFFKYKEAFIWSIVFIIGAVILLLFMKFHYNYWAQTGVLVRILAIYFLFFIYISSNDKIRIHLSENLLEYEKRLINEKQRAEEARQSAESAVKYKSRFVAVMSHEIRNPLSVIIGMIDLISIEQSDDLKKDYLAVIRDSSNHLLTLINNILDYSRLEEGKPDFNETEFSIRRIVNTIEVSHGPDFMRKGLYFKTTIDPDFPDLLMGDPSRIKQIVLNLIDNALKFTSSGGIEIILSQTRSSLPDMTDIIISVKDTGIGIPPERINDIFHAYEQINRNTQPTLGAGLGLTICRLLIDEMKGTVNVNSIPGQGSTFTVTLPLKIHTRKKTDQDIQENENTPLARFNILMAEDNPAVQLFLSMALTKAGHMVTIAHNGQEVIDDLLNSDYDCILMDIEMPILDGINTSSMIRNGQAGDKHKNVPIIALSGYALTPDSPANNKAYFNDFIQKPVSMRSLLKVIEKTMSNKA